MSRIGSLSVGLEKRAQTQFQDARNTTGLNKVTITISVVGAGELVTEVLFPVLFVEQPLPFVGCIYRGVAGILPAAEYTPGAMPIGTATVLAWTTQQSNTALYIGATMGVLTAGSLDDNIDVVVSFEGKATRRAGG